MPFFTGETVPQALIDTVSILESRSRVNQASYVASGLRSQVGGDLTKWILTSGTAFIFDGSDRNSEPVEFIAETDLTFDFPPPLLSNSKIWTYLDLNSQINYTLTQPRSWDLGDRLYLNIIESVDGIEISRVAPVVLEGDPYTKLLLDKGGTANIDLILSPGTGLSLSQSLGNVLIAGANFINDPASPHRIEIPAASQIIWDEYDPTGGLIAAGVTELNFGRYWDADTNQVVNFTGNDASAKFFYIDSQGNFSCYIGSNLYNSLNVISQRWLSYENPIKFSDRVLVCVALGRGDAVSTDSDRVILLERNDG